MSNNIPVNGWPQLKDLEAVQPTLDRLDKIEAWKRTVKEETFTGEEITIPNALALPARSLITEIEPIQDLHGLPFPYVGGAYKNKLTDTVISATVNGITFTAKTDGTVTAVGTATEQAVRNFYNAVTPSSVGLSNGTYIISGCPTGGGNDAYGLRVVLTKGSGNTTYSDYGSGNEFTIDSDVTAIRVYLYVASGQTVDITFKPMIRLSTETDPTFAPYSNICPISGRTAAVITRSDGDETSADFTIQLGQTVYGADINWDTGVATVDKKYLYVDGSDTSIMSTINVQLQIAIDSDSYTTESSTDTEFLICNRFNKINNASVESYGIYYRANGSHNLLVKNGYTENQPLSTWVDFLTANPLQIVYKLATPIELTLTPTEVQMLKGYNRVTLSDGYGTIELKALTGANWS